MQTIILEAKDAIVLTKNKKQVNKKRTGRAKGRVAEEVGRGNLIHGKQKKIRKKSYKFSQKTKGKRDEN